MLRLFSSGNLAIITLVVALCFIAGCAPVWLYHHRVHRWLGSRVVSVLDSGAEGPSSNRSRDAVR